jgi:beta-lactamase class D
LVISRPAKLHFLNNLTFVPNQDTFMRKYFLLSGLVLLLFSACTQTRLKEHKEWGDIFEKYGVNDGCFIMRDNNHESIHYYNKERCTQRFLPASTFKIFNSLVALETAVAPDDQLVIKWDSIKRMPDWDKDMNMKEAFKESNVGYYQEIARRIGPGRMQHYLDTVKYGNMVMAGHIDSFWLNNSLQISADEQAGFLKRMYFNELPFSERSQRIVKNLMEQEQTPDYNLYYKTGTGRHGDKYIYWIVGFIERIEHVKEDKDAMNKADFRNYPYFFAENFDVPVGDTTQGWDKVNQTRKDIMKAILKEYGAMPK